MKRKPIRNKESERVCDALIDIEKGRILLETKVGKNTMQIDYEYLKKEVEKAKEVDRIS